MLSNEANAKPKRRWFRFSLRTMLVAITIVTVWLGWNLHAVRQRKAALQLLSTRRPIEARTSSSGAYHYITSPDNGFGPLGVEYRPATPFRVSAVRRLLGDQPQKQIFCKRGSEAELMHSLFPEAYIGVPTGEEPRDR